MCSRTAELLFGQLGCKWTKKGRYIKMMREFKRNRLANISAEAPYDVMVLWGIMELGRNAEDRVSFTIILERLIREMGIAVIALLDDAEVYDNDVLRLALAARTPQAALAILFLVFAQKRTAAWLRDIAQGRVVPTDEDLCAWVEEASEMAGAAVDAELKAQAVAAAERIVAFG